jgi:DNA-binding NarL/FixJ family response regulator
MYNILIVDDEIDFLTYLDEALTQMGYEIAGMAITGESAVENARLLRPDLILMNIVMPGRLDGIDAARIIHDEMEVPIIFVSAHSEKKIVDRAKEAGPSAYLMKPVQEEELQIAIELAMYNSQKRSADCKQNSKIIFETDNLQDKRQVEKQMQKMIQTEAIKSLAAAITHQYNNAIMAISGYAQLIDVNYPDHTDLLSYSKSIQQAGKRISTIVGQLSVLTQREERNFQPESISELLQKVLPIIQETSLPGITWETAFDPDCYQIPADSTALQLALYSLVKYLTCTNEGESRTVRVICKNHIMHELSPDSPDNFQLNHYIYLKIQDDGFLPKDEVLKWTPNSYTIPSFSERNMNLFAAYHIIQNHGGNLTLDWESGKGTYVQVYFPAAPPAVTS